jgi:hypothetical protein
MFRGARATYQPSMGGFGVYPLNHECSRSWTALSVGIEQITDTDRLRVIATVDLVEQRHAVHAAHLRVGNQHVRLQQRYLHQSACPVPSTAVSRVDNSSRNRPG